MDLAKELGISTASSIKRTCTQDYIPIKEIRDGIVITEDNRYVKVMEISPSNLEMMSVEKRNAALAAYGGFISSAICPKRFQIKCTTRMPQTQEYLSVLRKSRSRETTPNILQTIDAYDNFISTEGRFESVDRQFHLIFDYEEDGLFFDKKSENEIIDALWRKSAVIEGELSGAGNRVIHYDNPDYEVAKFLYNHYNRRSHLTHPFSDRVKRIMEDTMKVNGLTDATDLPPADIRDLLAPRNISTKANPNHLLIDGMYRSHFYIDGSGFPTEISVTGWLSNLIRMGYGIDVDIYFTKLNTGEIMRSLPTRQRFTKGKAEDRSEFASDKEKIAENLGGLEYIRKSINEYNEELFDMSVMVTIYAYTYEELVLRESDFMLNAAKLGLEMRPGKNLQEGLFFATMPLNNLPPQIYNLTKHNLTTSGVVAAYPFTTFSLADKDGVLLGRHARNQNMLFYDQFDPKYANANIGIYGGSGKGKTYTLLSLMERLRVLGVQVFIMAPIKQHEFFRTVEAVDGLFVDMQSKSKLKINPFEVWELDSPDEKLLGGEGYIVPCYVENKIENMMTWFMYIIKDLDQAEEAKFRTALGRLYKNFGITEDNDSIYSDIVTKTKKTMPIFTDFINVLRDVFKEDTLSIDPQRQSKLITILENAAEYFDGQTNVDITNKFIVFGLEKVPKRWQAAVMAQTTQFIWDLARADRTKKKVVAIDEGWKMLNEKLMADFVEEMFKIIRGYGGGAIFSTQSVSDTFKASKDAGNAILACCNSNIVLGMEKKDARLLSNELDLTEAEIAAIESFTIGTALLIAGSNHVPLKVEASSYEHMLFTTKRKDLEEMAKAAKESRVS